MHTPGALRWFSFTHSKQTPIHFHNSSSSLPPQKQKTTAEPLSPEEVASLTVSPETAVVMTAHDGQKYFCSLPPAVAEGGEEGSSTEDDADDTSDSPKKQSSKYPPPKTAAKTAAAAKAAEKNSERDGKVVTELLEPLASACFYRIEGWWTYEFCHKKKVRQYHQEGEAITSEYSLGEYDAAATLALHDAQGHFPVGLALFTTSCMPDLSGLYLG
jgi:hypothetical protein